MLSGPQAAKCFDLLLDKIEEAIGVIDQLKENALAERARADRAELEVTKLEAETDRVEASRECPDHPDALQMIRCTACNQERHMPA
jgi:hypothetical protein